MFYEPASPSKKHHPCISALLLHPCFTILLHEDHADGRDMVSRLKATEVHTCGHLLAGLIQTVPGDGIVTGFLRLIHQCPHFLPQEIENAQ